MTKLGNTNFSQLVGNDMIFFKTFANNLTISPHWTSSTETIIPRVYGEIPPTLNIHTGSRDVKCYNITTIPQFEKRCLQRTANVQNGHTFHIYGICLNRNREVILPIGLAIEKSVIYKYVVKYYPPIICSVISAEAYQYRSSTSIQSKSFSVM